MFNFLSLLLSHISNKLMKSYRIEAEKNEKDNTFSKYCLTTKILRIKVRACDVMMRRATTLLYRAFQSVTTGIILSLETRLCSITTISRK